MGTPTLVCVWSCPNFSAPAGRPFRCVKSKVISEWDIQAAGSDTRPPMLDRTDYESWSQRIRLYCRGKENGLQILQSIDQAHLSLEPKGGPRNYPEGGVLLGQERPVHI
ncbi:hypothetical protein Tco_1093565 [Tanacetum coccineum]|uniref:Integrase, catalytic region, zinc finger, CCHC-type, peptidase aspartic, catalytic n=1 Tax=Tanacetum coccineum TaxID=301880 RepID=A0ABQ5IFG8_9ASTR